MILLLVLISYRNKNRKHYQGAKMFHINDKDEARTCRAKTPANCKFYKGEDDTRHYETVADAQSFIEEKLKKENGGSLEKKVRYSFVKEFKKQEDQFNKDFDGVPNRFFNADLRGKTMPQNVSDEQLLAGKRSFQQTALNVRMMTAISQPSDNKINNKEVSELLTSEGYENIEEIKDPVLLKDFKSDRAWKTTLDGEDVVVIDGNAGTKISSKYAFRRDNEYFKAYSYWYKLDLRKIAGNKRIKEKTGNDIMGAVLNTETHKKAQKEHSDAVGFVAENIQNLDVSDERKQQLIEATKSINFKKIQTIDTLQKIEDAQLEGRNFIAQKKYVREHSSKIATVWDDKKDTDDIRKDLIKNSTVKDIFRKIDLDNDVDPGEYKNFEKDLNDVKSKLPSIPRGLEPELRLRKLGKHSSSSFTVNGLYNPVKNSIGISVENSASTIHELMHFYDLTVKNNASLSGEFREISKEYMKDLKMPQGLESKESYYSVATEQLARGGEIWASERLGIDNRLLDKEKFKSFDYAPFMENPQLKEKVFKFFDRLFEEDKNN